MSLIKEGSSLVFKYSNQLYESIRVLLDQEIIGLVYAVVMYIRMYINEQKQSCVEVYKGITITQYKHMHFMHAYACIYMYKYM